MDLTRNPELIRAELAGEEPNPELVAYYEELVDSETGQPFDFKVAQGPVDSVSDITIDGQRIT